MPIQTQMTNPVVTLNTSEHVSASVICAHFPVAHAYR